MSEKCLAVVEIDQDLCSQCCVCHSICPYDAIKRDSTGKVEINNQECQVCGICYSACPSSAIKMQYYTYDNLSDYVKQAREKVKNGLDTLVLMCRGNSPSTGEVQEFKGDKQVKAVTLIDNTTGIASELAVDAVFVQVGEAPNSQHAKAAGIETDEHGYIKVDMSQHTNLIGVFAAGDVTDQPIKQVGTAVGQGITAALEAYSYIRRPYYKK